VIAFSLT